MTPLMKVRRRMPWLSTGISWMSIECLLPLVPVFGPDGPGRPSGRVVRVCDRAPHVSGRAVVVTEPFRRLLEVAPDDVDERIERNRHALLERVQVVQRDQPSFHVVRVVPGELVRVPDVV